MKNKSLIYSPYIGNKGFRIFPLRKYPSARTSRNCCSITYWTVDLTECSCAVLCGDKAEFDFHVKRLRRRQSQRRILLSLNKKRATD